MLADAKPVPEGPAGASGRKGRGHPQEGSGEPHHCGGLRPSQPPRPWVPVRPVRPASRPRGRRPVRWPLAGKVVLVTGAARGIGAATARVAAARGARVALVGLEPELLAALAASLGPGHTWRECDVTDQAGLDRAVAAVAETLGGIDVVVANAGVANNGTVAANPVSALVRTIEVDLIGVVRTVSATLPQVTRSRGYYLLVSSAAAFTVLPGMAGYCAAKAGVEQFGNALRLELAHKGVAVGTAHMGWVDTDLVRDLRDDLPALGSALPWPLRGTMTPARCAEALVDGIEHRRRRVYVPRALAGIQATRTVFTGPLADVVLRRGARTLVPELEREVARLGRPFGRHSTALDADRSGEPVR
jgi:NAD(P)-dependent dehydrogenase (short-subunit alcohol dehydrogenase family)